MATSECVERHGKGLSNDTARISNDTRGASSMRRESSGCQAPLTFDRMWSVFAVPLHQFVGIGQEDGRTQGRSGE